MRSRSFFPWLLAPAWLLGCSSSGDGGSAPSLSRWIGASSEPVGSSSVLLPAPAVPALPPRVSLDGQARPPSAGASAIRLFARTAKAWVYETPSEDAPHVGYLRAGAAVGAGPAQGAGHGCAGQWHPVLPRGFVCVGTAVTLDANDPIVVALGTNGPSAARKLPYIYGTVRKPGPVYARLPKPEELARTEGDLERRMTRWLGAEGEVGASYAQQVWLGGVGTLPEPALAWQERRTEGVPAWLGSFGSVPNLHQRPRDADQLVIGRMRAKVGYSFVETFLWEGRRYGLTPELEILPTDRLRPIQGSEFHGVELGKGVEFPLALVRKPGTRFTVHERVGNRLVRGEIAPYREAVPLTGRQQFFRDVLHFETKSGFWLADRDASRLDPVKKVPGWALKGEKWIDVNLTKQALVLYEGTRPVYATLISSGEAGLADSASTTATRRGIFRIHGKHVATTMASDEVGEEFELRDVPYVQYFDDGGHALHGAYWHDRFGIPKSHGCVNLAPEDARRIFYWTEPAVPDGWHGALSERTGTILFIHP